jgi:hypothetical protein
VLTIEVKDEVNRPVAQFAIFPLPSGMALPLKQYETFRYIARATGERYFFLVTSDMTFGWNFASDPPESPSFKCPTADLLARYAGSATAVETAGESFLAELVHAWLADLATGWKGPGPVPGEAEIARTGFLENLRTRALVSSTLT